MNSNNKIFSQRVLDWYDEHGRKDLPWQKNRKAYCIWVSEIMLQQTRVDSVIPYYEKFLQRFPTVEELAHVDVDEVLHYWTGLGYYARARNLHRAAQIICEQYGGHFPQQIEQVIALPGIGRSTAAAILALSFNQSHAILDGNVKRVLARYFAIEGWPGQKQIETILWQHADELLPNERVAAYTQAMMDLGATLCTRNKPNCKHCPVQKTCSAFNQQLQHILPTPKPSKKIPQREILIAIVQCTNERSIWLEKRSPSGVWGGLYSFPEFENDQQLQHWVSQLHPQAVVTEEMPSFTHIFTHFRLHLHPRIIHIPNQPNSVMEDDLGVWYKKTDQKIGLAAPVKKVLAQVLKHKKEITHDAHGAMCEA